MSAEGEEELIEGKLWGVCGHDDLGTTIRITRTCPFSEPGPNSERVVIGRLGWDPRFPHLHRIEYNHVDYSVDWGTGLICISCEEGPGEIHRDVLEALGIFNVHDTTQRGYPPEHLRNHVEEYRLVIANAPYQWLAIVIQGNIQTIPEIAFVCRSRPNAKLSVAVVDMRDSHVRSIAPRAFLSCKILTQVYFSSVLEEICENAFQNSRELGWIGVPRSLARIAMKVFDKDQRTPLLNIDDGVPAEQRVVVHLQVWDIDADGASWLTMYKICGGRDSVNNIHFAPDWRGRTERERVTGPIPLITNTGARPEEGTSACCAIQ
jgi:hypothetical protein